MRLKYNGPSRAVRGRIDSLLIQVQVDANRLKVLDGAQQVDQRSSEPVDCPSHDNIELPAARILKQKIEAGPIGAPLRATDAGVVVNLHHLPAAPLCFIDPCIPNLASKPPSGPDWVHEIKHDGYGLIVRRDGETVRLFTRRGYD